MDSLITVPFPPKVYKMSIKAISIALVRGATDQRAPPIIGHIIVEPSSCGGNLYFGAMAGGGYCVKSICLNGQMTYACVIPCSDLEMFEIDLTGIHSLMIKVVDSEGSDLSVKGHCVLEMSAQA